MVHEAVARQPRAPPAFHRGGPRRGEAPVRARRDREAAPRNCGWVAAASFLGTRQAWGASRAPPHFPQEMLRSSLSAGWRFSGAEGPSTTPRSLPGVARQRRRAGWRRGLGRAWVAAGLPAPRPLCLPLGRARSPNVRETGVARPPPEGVARLASEVVLGRVRPRARPGCRSWDGNAVSTRQRRTRGGCLRPPQGALAS